MLPFLILNHFDWILDDDMEFVLFLEGPFQIEISSNECTLPLWEIVPKNQKNQLEKKITMKTKE